jgi:hypothetical protein
VAGDLTSAQRCLPVGYCGLSTVNSLSHHRGMCEPAPIEVMTADAYTWHDGEQLFGRAGASNGCWCQYWMLGAD